MANPGLMLVDFELLRQVLRLPKGTRIIDAMVTEQGFRTGGVTLKLESDDFPATLEGQMFPSVNAEFTADDDGYPVFVQWKIE